MSHRPSSTSAAGESSSNTLGQVWQAVQSDVDSFAEEHLDRTSRFLCPHAPRAAPNEEILSSICRIEAFWDQLVSCASDDGTDRFLAASMEDLDERIHLLRADLEAAKDLHQRGRAALLSELCVRRRRAAGVEKASSSLMRPAQVTSAIADAEAKGKQQSAANDAVRRQPWLAKQWLESGIVEEGEVRLSLDHRYLLDLSRFDSSERCGAAAAAATAAVWARFEAQKTAWSGKYEEEKLQLEAEIRAVREEEEVQQKQHEAMVAKLMAKYEAHEVQKRRQTVVGRARSKPAQAQGSLRASILSAAQAQGNAAAAASTALPWDAHAMSSPSPQNQVEEKLNLINEMFGPPLSQASPVRQWGARLVDQIGLNSHPRKPEGFSRRVAKVPPRVARSLEEAFSIEPESDESMYLSRYMLGASRTMGSSYDPRLYSNPASTTESIT